MKKLLLILLCLPMIGFGQGFIKAYDSGSTSYSEGHSIKQTSDGGYILVGNTRIQPVWDDQYVIFLIKIDSNGNEIWRQTFGPGHNLEGNCVIETNDGGFVIATKIDSSFSGSHDKKVGLIKVDNLGNNLWSRFFIGSGGYSLIETGNNELVLLTQQKDNIWQAPDPSNVLIKTDELGNQLWSLSLGQEGSDLYEASLQETNMGDFIITIATGGDNWLIKVDTNGNEVWSKEHSYNNSGSSQSTAVLPVNDGFIISGAAMNNGEFDVWLLKTDLSGDKDWEYIYGVDSLGEGAYSIDYTHSNGFILAGSGEHIINGEDTEQNIMLLEVDENGLEQWKHIYTDFLFWYDYDDYNILTKDYDESDAYSVSSTNDGGYILTGEYSYCAFTDSSFSGPGEGIIVIKTDGNGNVTSTFNIAINPNRKLQRTVDILGRETKPQINTPLIEIYDDGTVEKKVIIE